MSFLAPLFLLGGLAVALPVIFHLIRRTTKERKIFSSLMFLQPSPPRFTRRSRLEHLLLLALRCLVLCLLAAGFARPFIRKAVDTDPAAGAAKRQVILVDTSASMRRANLWSDARDRVDAILRRAAPADQVAVFAFDRELRPVMTFEQWQSAAAGERAALAGERLREISPGWGSTHLGNALISAAETLTDTGDKSTAGLRQIILVSDLQEGSRLDQLQGYEWPKGVALTIESLKPRHAGNAGLQLVTDADETDRKAGAVVRVRVNNAADSKREQFQVGWRRANETAFAGAPVDVYVPPGQSRIVPVPAPAGVAPDRIVLQGDDEDFDNTVFTVPPETARLSVLYFGNDTEKDSKQPLYFLQRAFQQTRRQDVRVLLRAPEAPVSAAEAQAAALVVVVDPLPDALADALHAAVAGGKTALVAMKSEAAAATLARLCGVNRVALEDVQPPNHYAMLAEMDFNHPLFAPFADPRFSDFTRIHFWKYRRLDAAAVPGARVVAKFDSGDPALLDVPVGKGRVLVLTSGWQPDDSQLALSTKFVPLLYSTLDYSGVSLAPPGQFRVGDPVPLAAPGVEPAAATIRVPDGSQLSLAAGETNFSRTTMPGIYVLTSARSSREFAVNLDPVESRTSPLAADELERLGAPLAQPAAIAAREAEHQARLQNSELENRQKLWRWVLLATLAVLLFETWLAGRTARRLTVEGATS